MNNQDNYNKGSEWRKWDLHIHTPLSICQDYKGNTDAIWEKYICALENLPPEVKVIGINDYYFLDGYEKVMTFKKNGRMPNIDKIFPILEFRIDTFSSASESKFGKINLHILFDLNESKISQQIKQVKDEFIGNIHLSKVHETAKLSLSNFQEYSSDKKLKTGFSELIPSTEEVLKIINSTQWKDKTFLLLGYKEWNDLEKSVQLKQNKISLYKIANAFFTATTNDSLTQKEKVLGFFDKDHAHKPLLYSQDIHNFRTLDTYNFDRNGVKTKSSKYKCLTWIKADPTFEGLKQIIYEPEERVKIQESSPEYENEEKPHFKELSIDQDLSVYNTEKLIFKKDVIQLNKNLVTIIGGRGEGKSTLINYLANTFNNYKLPSSEKRSTFTQSQNFQIKYYKLNTPIVKNTDRIIYKNSEKEDNELSYIFIPQGGLREKCRDNQELSQNIKYMLKITEPNFSKKLATDILETNNSISLIEKWLRSTDENGDYINTRKYHNGILKTNKILLKNLKNSKNQEMIEKYNNNLTLLSKYQEIVSEADIVNEKISDFITDIFDIINIHKNVFPPLNLDDYQGKITQITKEYNKLIQKTEKENKEIAKTLKTFGLSGDIKNLLEDASNHQSLIDQAKKSLYEIKLKEKMLEKLKKKRATFGKQIMNEYIRQEKEINCAWENFLNRKQDIVRNILLNKDKIEVRGKIIFDEEMFLKILYESVNKNSYKNITKLKEDFKISNPESWSNYILNDFNKHFEKIYYKREEFIDLFFATEIRAQYFRTEAEILYDGKELFRLSAGQKGTAYLRLQLANSAFTEPLIFDQPEDDLDNKFIVDELIGIFKELKKYRQIIIVTHNANLVVNADAEQVIVAHNQNEELSYFSGSLENPQIQKDVCDILEGGKEAFKQRRNKYNIKE